MGIRMVGGADGRTDRQTDIRKKVQLKNEKKM